MAQVVGHEALPIVLDVVEVEKSKVPPREYPIPGNHLLFSF